MGSVAEAATVIWDGGTGATGTDLATPANWFLDALPATGDTAQWTGMAGGPLSLTINSNMLNSTNGIALDVTAGQVESLQIDNAATTSANSVRLQNITIA